MRLTRGGGAVLRRGQRQNFDLTAVRRTVAVRRPLMMYGGPTSLPRLGPPAPSL